ncbi:MAG: hypothetical protein KA419_13950 [Acidobacteria bacterium]|nr:hypothetical protein [Acidobacteriota bacterium]
MSDPELSRLILSADLPSCVEFFREMSETERRKLAKTALAEWSSLHKRFWSLKYGNGEKNTACTRENLDAAALCVIATASVAEMAAIRFDCFWADSEKALQMLGHRRPPWLQDLADTLAADPNKWQYVWSMARAGLCLLPDSDGSITGMIHTLALRWRDSSIDSAFRESLVLLGRVHRLFEVEGIGENSLAACDKYMPEDKSWSNALCSLCADGLLAREKLLDDSLRALNMDFA